MVLVLKKQMTYSFQCSLPNYIKLGCLSTELIRAKIKTVILFKCYSDLFSEAGKEDVEKCLAMPSYYIY